MVKSIIRHVLTASFVTATTVAHAHAQSCPNPASVNAGLSGPIATVRYLADDALAGRLAGSDAERCAANYIAAQFKRIGLDAIGDSASYFQGFSLTSVINPHAPGGRGRNVVALLPGSDPQLKSEYIVIGAHYDHLGMGRFGSTSSDTTPAIHNGADDNASGVAALIEVAEKLKRARPARSVVFIAFSGEEEGLLGSAHYAGNPIESLTQTRGMINMDMVGRLGRGPLIVYGIGTATEWKAIVNQAAAAHKIPVTLVDDGYGASDHTSFYLKDIPVLHFFTNVHDDYHKPSDDWERIDRAGLVTVSNIVADVAQQIANKTTTLTLVKGAGKPPQAPGAARGSAASLGTIPDMGTLVPKGVRLSGVRENSPAQIAGIKAGDILIRFDDTEITDLQAMADALRVRKPGDAVRVTVLRDGKEMVFNATLGKR
jgi:hypothetical protein